jgi:hypothetical protein
VRETIEKLHLVTLDPEGHEKTCDYWYLVQTSCFAHTAFNRRESLIQWLQERGLSLTKELPQHGTFSVQDITGSYRRQMHTSYDEFYALQGARTRTLSNGDWTLAIITTDGDGLKTVHTLNPNCHDRQVFDYRESRALHG